MEARLAFISHISPRMDSPHPANLVHGTDADLASLIAKPGITLVDFWATWCGPCRVLGPILEQLAAAHPEVQVVKVDVDQNQRSAAQYQIMSIPTVYVFKDGRQVTDPIPGAQRPQVYEMILSQLQGGTESSAA